MQSLVVDRSFRSRRRGGGYLRVIAILIASDLMRGTGRFNFAQGLVALCVGVGAGLSNLISGFVVHVRE
jgi:hypothetical protein